MLDPIPFSTITGSTTPSSRIALAPLTEEHLRTVILIRLDRVRPAATRTDSWTMV